MSEALDYRLVQFCPSPNDEVRVNIGVDVSDGDTHHLLMLNKTDLRRRCKMLTGKEPSTTNGVVNQLVEHSRWLTRMSKGYPLPAEFADRSFMPEIISTPGRFNNLVRLSEPILTSEERSVVSQAQVSIRRCIRLHPRSGGGQAEGICLYP